MARSTVDFQKANFLLEDVRASLEADMRRRIEESVDRFLAEAEALEGQEFDDEFKRTSKAAMTHAGHNNPAASLRDKADGAKLHADAAAMAKKKGYTSMEKFHASHEKKITGSLKQMGGG